MLNKIWHFKNFNRFTDKCLRLFQLLQVVTNKAINQMSHETHEYRLEFITEQHNSQQNSLVYYHVVRIASYLSGWRVSKKK